MSIISSASQIYRKEGLLPLVRKSNRYAFEKVLRAPVVDDLLYYSSRKDLKIQMDSEEDISDIIDTVVNVRPGYGHYKVYSIQLSDELYQLLKLVRKENTERVLEIGTANGGSFYTWCRGIPDIKRVVSLDLPNGRYGGGYNERKINIFKSFSDEINMEFVRGNSHKKPTYKKVKNIANNDGFDFIFIDGDHSFEGVKKDFHMYKQLLSDDGVIALHDIIHHPDDPDIVRERKMNTDAKDRHLNWGIAHPDVNVKKFWDEVCEEYKTKEIVSHPDQTWGGIGVVYPKS
ncbi:O-methyltransferase [Halorubrum sp. N11]|uniref:O-methyltransferase n=1 Tax=Halorubrum sp. N11 TaxID=3402276 RepID=UPI003EBDFC18